MSQTPSLLKIIFYLMLVHVKTLSLWEIAHYWHDCDPRLSSTHQIPLKVRDTLLVLIKNPNKKFIVFVEKRRAYLLKILSYIQETCTESFLQNLQDSIDKKEFDKHLFGSMLLTRNALARWCIENNEPLPKFWFPDNDKYPYDLNYNDIEDTGRYKFLLIHDGTKNVGSASEVEKSTPLTVNNNAIKAAKAKHAPTNAIKGRFISFYQIEGNKYPSKTALAKHFFDSLNKQKEQLLFNSCETATRVLLEALREHEKQIKSS